MYNQEERLKIVKTTGHILRMLLMLPCEFIPSVETPN